MRWHALAYAQNIVFFRHPCRSQGDLAKLENLYTSVLSDSEIKPVLVTCNIGSLLLPDVAVRPSFKLINTFPNPPHFSTM